MKGVRFMSLATRWAQDHIFFRTDGKTGEQFMLDTATGITTPLTPDSPNWDHNEDDLYYKHHPDKRPKQ
ncbi:hypothetical protein GCWU000246_00007 [Jonquetella anthropi E3_33 E1]|nr:hypothetical protein GCWU000246_00007 [Jonquetella anthropi E3_33 E1]